MLPRVCTPTPGGGCQVIAMVHVHCTTILMNTPYTSMFSLPPLTPADMHIIQRMANLLDT